MQINYKRTTYIFATAFILSLVVTIAVLAGNLNAPIAAPVGAPTNGSRGNALDFDGIDDYVALTGTFGGPSWSEMTIEAWVKIDAYGGSQSHYAVVAPIDTHFAHFQFKSDGAGTDEMGFATDEGPVWLNTSQAPAAGEWEHWAMVGKSGESKLYRNGVEVASNILVFDTISSTNQLQIGNGFGGNRYFNGQIDEVRIWDQARTFIEIAAYRYSELDPGFYPRLVAYYQMEDGLGTDADSTTTLTDIAGGDNNGTLTNMDGDVDWAGRLWNADSTGSNGGLTITDVSFLNHNGDHLDFIHNDGSGTTTADLPSGFEERWNRVWTCNVQDDPDFGLGGNVQLVFQSSTDVEPIPGKYWLLHRTGTTGTFTNLQAADSVDTSADTITFNTVSATGLCSQITIGLFRNVVTNINDSGPGSLRQAINNVGTGETIIFNLSNYPATVTLTGGQLVIDKNLTITGPGADQVTVSGNDASRVFYVNSGITAEISGLTISDGNVGSELFDPGGGIYNLGTLTVNNMTFSVNTANWTGGGIYNNSGNLTVNNSTFYGNSADLHGGGMLNEGTSELTNVTFSMNTADYGGGMYLGFLRTSLTNVTIFDNSADLHGGGIHHGGAGDMFLNNSILANNTDSSGGMDYFCGSGNYVEGNNNLIVNRNAYCVISGSNNIFGQGSLLNPVLADNGGPTLTHALMPGSPAIDHIPNGTNGCGTTITQDQRGSVRPLPVGGPCDIGAYESGGVVEIDIEGNNQPISDGDNTPATTDHTEFGAVGLSASAIGHTFTISNTGDALLSLDGSPRVEIAGTGASAFSLTAAPPASIPGFAASTFQIGFDPSMAGLHTAFLILTSNDGDENPYNFKIQGTGFDPAANASTQTIPNGGASAYLSGVTIINNSTNRCTFTVTYNPIPPGSGSPDPGEMPMQWVITTDGTCGTLDVDLIFHYTADELANGSGVTAGELKAFRLNSATWEQLGGTVDTTAHTVRLNNVTTLSDWTIGDPTAGTPTAVTLTSFAVKNFGRTITGLIVAAVWGISAGVIGVGGWRRWRQSK